MIGFMMNREIRRVPMDFDWPLDKTWLGYHMVPYDYRNERKFDDEDTIRGSEAFTPVRPINVKINIYRKT